MIISSYKWENGKRSSNGERPTLLKTRRSNAMWPGSEITDFMLQKMLCHLKMQNAQLLRIKQNKLDWQHNATTFLYIKAALINPHSDTVSIDCHRNDTTLRPLVNIVCGYNRRKVRLIYLQPLKHLLSLLQPRETAVVYMATARNCWCLHCYRRKLLLSILQPLETAVVYIATARNCCCLYCNRQKLLLSFLQPAETAVVFLATARSCCCHCCNRR